MQRGEEVEIPVIGGEFPPPEYHEGLQERVVRALCAQKWFDRKHRCGHNHCRCARKIAGRCSTSPIGGFFRWEATGSCCGEWTGTTAERRRSKSSPPMN
jgi:hypothetical protein